MWRHAVALLIGIAVTLVAFEFWGRFGGAMTHVAKIATETAMPVSVVPAAPGSDCTKGGPCPVPPSTVP